MAAFSTRHVIAIARLELLMNQKDRGPCGFHQRVVPGSMVSLLRGDAPQPISIGSGNPLSLWTDISGEEPTASRRVVV